MSLAYVSNPTGGAPPQTTRPPSSGINVRPAERAASALFGAALLLLAGRQQAGARALSTIAGAALVLRGIRGRSRVYRALGIDRVGTKTVAAPWTEERSITIGRPADALFALFRDIESWKEVLAPLAEITTESGRTSWRVAAPLGRSFSWDTSLVEETAPTCLRWRSYPGGDLDHELTVNFRPAPGDWGTVVTLRFHLEHPSLVTKAAMALDFLPRAAVSHVLRRFKSLVETGELPTLAKNPSARP